jgi:hypothetical protein
MPELSPLWKTVKEKYEKATQEKKPSKTFLGIRTGSGIESALTVLDKTASPTDAAKALVDLKKAIAAFEPLVEKRIKEATAEDKKHGDLIKDESQKLLKTLSNIEKDFAPARHKTIATTFLEAKVEEEKAKQEKWTIQNVMENSVYSKKLHAYCKSEHNDENFDFLIAVKSKKKEEEIFGEFIAETTAPRPINLPSALFAELRDPADGDKPLKKGLSFNKAASSIIGMMKADVLPRFRAKEMKDYREALKKKLDI